MKLKNLLMNSWDWCHKDHIKFIISKYICINSIMWIDINKQIFGGNIIITKENTRNLIFSKCSNKSYISSIAKLYSLGTLGAVSST